jgi:hypothetical protein
VTREVLREVAESFYRALYASERVKLASDAVEAATAVVATAERRAAAGDIGVLEVYVARGAAARVASEVPAFEAERERAEQELRVLLALPAGEALALRGSLSADAGAGGVSPALGGGDLPRHGQSGPQLGTRGEAGEPGERVPALPTELALQAELRSTEAELAVASRTSLPGFWGSRCRSFLAGRVSVRSRRLGC